MLRFRQFGWFQLGCSWRKRPKAECSTRISLSLARTVNPQLLLLALLTIAPTSAFAYVDPGSGMLVWQGLIAAFGMLIAFVRHPLDAIRNFLERFKRK